MLDALDELEQIADPTARARAISRILKDQTERNPRLKEMRREAVLALRDEGMSLRKIAAALETSLGTVQAIISGHSQGWTKRPKGNPDDTDGRA